MLRTRLHQNSLRFGSRHRYLCTAGARPNPRWLQLLLDQGCQMYCGFDAGPSGDQMACAMMARHPDIKRLRPSQHDSNDVLRAQASSLSPFPGAARQRHFSLPGQLHYSERRSTTPSSCPVDHFIRTQVDQFI